ncbi:MAG: site-2 protease family protein [Gammaproteobacteria bacterium]|nr:site-2 protease family protein [Gammaproteobacteria bacterium]
MTILLLKGAIFLLKFVVYGIPAILAVTVHEFAHGWVANRLGDPTAAREGRLSINPLRHVDPIGTIAVPALVYFTSGFFFGWAKPVPVNWRNLGHFRRDVALVAVAGPAANLLMLLAWTCVLLLAQGDPKLGLLRLMGSTGVLFNATIMLLNLLPIPPLDGSRIVTALLPGRTAVRYNRVEPYGLIILALLLMSGVVGTVLAPGLHGIEQAVNWIIQ